MRCSKCDMTIKHAGKISRNRGRVCGTCMYAVKTISSKCPNCLNKLDIVKSHAR